MRWVGLLALGAIGLHELRYVLGPGAHAHETAVHSYLPLALALAVLAFVVALIDFVTTLVAANGDRVRLGAPSRVSRSWPMATVALVVIFILQESLEGALFGGHSAGLHGLFGHGGWSVAIFAPLLGVLIAFLVRGSEKAIELAARSDPRPRLKPARVIAMRPPTSPPPRPRLLARHLAGRAPPLYVA